MTPKIQEAAEKYAAAFTVGGGIQVINEEILNAFTAGASFMLEELSKGVEFLTAEGYKDLHGGNFVLTSNGSKNPPVEMIDIAALQSANAKIAKLTEALKDIYDAALEADIDESHLANVIEQAYLESCSQYDEQAEEKI